MKDTPSKFALRMKNAIDFDLKDRGEVAVVAHAEAHGTLTDTSFDVRSEQRRWRRGDIPNVDQLIEDVADVLANRKDRLNDQEQGTFAFHSVTGRIVVCNDDELFVSELVECQ